MSDKTKVVDNFGKEIAAARDAWLETDEGKQCLDYTWPPAGKYLRNRLERAFIAGFDAAIAIVSPQEK